MCCALTICLKLVDKLRMQSKKEKKMIFRQKICLFAAINKCMKCDMVDVELLCSHRHLNSIHYIVYMTGIMHLKFMIVPYVLVLSFFRVPFSMWSERIGMNYFIISFYGQFHDFFSSLILSWFTCPITNIEWVFQKSRTAVKFRAGWYRIRIVMGHTYGI